MRNSKRKRNQIFPAIHGNWRWYQTLNGGRGFSTEDYDQAKARFDRANPEIRRVWNEAADIAVNKMLADANANAVAEPDVLHGEVLPRSLISEEVMSKARFVFDWKCGNEPADGARTKRLNQSLFYNSLIRPEKITKDEDQN
jgi:hypothetical protein